MQKKVSKFIMIFLTMGLLCSCAGNEVGNSVSVNRNGNISKSNATTPVPSSTTTTVETSNVKNSSVKEINSSKATVIKVPKVGHFEKLADGGCIFFTGNSVSYGLYPNELEPAKLEAIRYDKNGNILWNRTYSELNNVVGGAGSLPDGTILFSSYTGSKHPKTGKFKSTGWLVKIASNGNILWKTAITKNYQSAFAFYFAKNGDIYTQGLFNGEVAASKLLIFNSSNAATADLMTTFCHYDKNGKELSHHSPKFTDTSMSGGEIADNFAKAAYVEGAGIVAVYPGGVICYRSDLSQKWKYTTDVKSYPMQYNRGTLLVGDPRFGKDSVTFTINGGRHCNDNTTAEISYSSGKLISKFTFSGSGDDIGTLPDGRDIYLESAKKNYPNYKTTVSFLKDGERNKLDYLGKYYYWLASLYPIRKGGFAIVYHVYGGKFGDAAIITNYDSSGKIKWQTVHNGNVNAFVSSSGVAFVGLPRSD